MVSRKVLLTGDIGVGKTVTVKYFGQMLTEAAAKRDLNIDYFHINCRKERTGYKILIKVMKHFEENFPNRGHSYQDIVDALSDILNRKNIHMVLVLDELNYLIKKNDDIIYTLTRLNDESINTTQRISIIGIVRDISCLNNLDDSTLSTLQRNIIRFNKYTKNEIIEILKSRAKVAIRPNIVDDEIFSMISDMIYKKGDIRIALELLWASIKIAESKGLKVITLECVRLANNENLLSYSIDFLNSLKTHKLLFILSILRVLRKSNLHFTTISDIQNEFNRLCENLYLSTRSYSQIMNYLHEIESYGLITIKVNSKNIKGRKSQISINEISLSKLDESISTNLRNRGINI